ncbi:MAG: M48 family metallopeptidase [Porphyromonadaceae bacterium]|nr:M48 family metallopeptidase [Porphyromonadaceae bacterium]
MTPNTLFFIILSVFIADFIFGRYLSWLNIMASKNKLPIELEDIYDNEQYQRQQQYFRTNSKFGMISSLFSSAIMIIFLILQGFAIVNEIVVGWQLSSIWSSIVFFSILYIANDIIGLPFDIYDTFVIEQRFGFNRTTIKTFVFDKVKALLLTTIIGIVLLYSIISIYNATPDYFWLLAWSAVTLFGLFMSLFYSDLIVPLFNKQTPLPEGELRNKIEAFASKAQFNLKNIYTIDGSKRSTKANAYFTGMFGKKRIVLYDTLIQTLTPEEIVAVLAHEIGHYRHRHTVKSLAISLPFSLLLFWLLGMVLQSNMFAQALGVATATFHINIITFGILYTPLSMLLGVVQNVVSRRFEYQADNFAKSYGLRNELISSLKKLSADSLSNLTPHRLVVFINYSHPTLCQRILKLNRD